MAISVGELEAVLRLRDELGPALRTTNETVKKSTDNLKEWTDAQQRAEMAMASAHEAALNMDKAYASPAAGKYAGVVGQVTQAMSRSAGVFGVNEKALRGLNDVAETFEAGLGSLGQKQAGFNVATLAGVGAAASLGYAIGGLAREHIPGLAKAADTAAAGLVRLFTAQKDLDAQANAMRGLSDFQAKMAASHAAAQEKQVAGLRAAGQTTEQIIAFLEGKRITSSDRIIDKLKDEEAATKKAAEAAKKAAAENAEAILKAQEAHEKYKQSLHDVFMMQQAFQKTIDEDIEKEKERSRIATENASKLLASVQKQAVMLPDLGKVIDPATGLWTRYADVVEQELENATGEVEEHVETTAEQFARLSSDLGEVANALGELDHLFGLLGHSADSDLRRAIQGLGDLARAGEDGAKAFAQFSSGDIVGGIRSSISAIGSAVSGVKKLFFGGQQEHMAVNDLRDEFLKGFDPSMFKDLDTGTQALAARAAEAGISLDKLFSAKRVEDYEAAVEEVMAKLGEFDKAQADALQLQADSQEALNAAVERYGFSIEELGPKFRQQELDKMAGQLLQDYKLLTASGIDQGLVLEKMGGAFSEYAQTAIASGLPLAESLRGPVEQLIEQGKLLDANGNAYASVEEAGITFAQTMEQQFSTLIDKIDQMVNALLGIPNVERTVTVTEQFTGQPAGGGPAPHEYHAAAGFDGMVYKPTRFLTGEAGPEHVKVTPAGGGGGGGDMSQSISVQIGSIGNNVDKATLDAVVAAVAEGVRRGTPEGQKFMKGMTDQGFRRG